MPVDITKLNKQTTQKVQYSPKFFNDKLTGKGGKVGVLSVLRNPANLSPNITSSQEAFRPYRYKFQNNGALIEVTPMSVISRDMWRNNINTYYHPDTAEMTKLANLGKEGEIYIHTRMFSAMYTETPSTMKNGTVSKKWELVYQIFLYRIIDKTTNECRLVDSIGWHSPNENEVQTFFTANPVKKITNIGPQLPQNWQKFITPKALMNYACGLSAFDLCAKEAERWSNGLHTEIDWIMKNAEINANQRSVTDKNNFICNETASALRFLETYKVPLEEYKEIYKAIANRLGTDAKAINQLCKNNLNLLLSDTLNELNDNKAKLHRINPQTNVTVSGKRYSPEQLNAITTTEPLTIVQAGAGTGKSTVILGRINYLVNAGAKPEDITVLSFTNAAADHIKEKNPNVHSMTIAAMINSIYSMNFPGQQLSENKTIFNSIDIFFPATNGGRDPFYSEFQKQLKHFIKNDNESYSRMNDFVENNYDKVIDTLETIKQVSLELQIIICYQKIEHMLEPKDVQSKFLIIDEVQDNSIFEFVYFLKYVNKHQESLFIVGDGAQTLYEFRASNPRALNIMEASGVFQSYQLNTNYRSNQEILDFANIFLDRIEANRFAKIQLQSNNILNKVTHKSFTDKVKLHYEFIPKLKGMSDALDTWLSLYVKKYIDDKLKYNERITFLAYRRETVFRVQNWLEQNYPGYKIANLVPEKAFSSDILSKFICKYWNEAKFMPSVGITTDICQAILRRLDFLVRDSQKALKPTQKMLNDWANTVADDVTVWHNQYVNNQISKDEFLSLIQQSMIQYEIENNNIRRSLISQRNEETKRQQAAETANFVLSTIHSAKGLEFENVVVIYRNDNSMGEEQKRMYYVALTRAMKSEYILAFDSSRSPQIKADYDTICKLLKEKAAKKTGITTNNADD